MIQSPKSTNLKQGRNEMKATSKAIFLGGSGSVRNKKLEKVRHKKKKTFQQYTAHPTLTN